MTYTTIDSIRNRYNGDIDAETCLSLIEEAGIIIDSYNKDAEDSVKEVVTVRMVTRALGSITDMSVPVGASQGSMSGLGYSQSWTMPNGSVGEVYLTKTEKKMLGVGNRIGSHSPLEDLCEG